jgi:hypothetical protein
MRTRHVCARVLLPLAIAALLAGMLSARQGPTGLRASWGDLETWSHYLEESRENELGLGLQLSGSNGVILVAFLGRLNVRTPLLPPREITVQVGTSERANPNVIRRPVLTLLLDDKSDRRRLLDLSSRLTVDDPAPGAAFENGLARISAADFVRAAEADTISGNVFGFDVVWRRDQIDALASFGRRVHLITADPRRQP